MEAGQGKKALELSSRSADPIHLLVTDMLMPEMNGSELANCLLANRPSLPVLYISGYSDDEARRLGGIECSAEFLQKPFRPDALLAKVRQILDAQKNSVQQTLL
jgi:DNA-binding response OmpR family regulator